MQRALYDSDSGYYTQNIRDVGGGTGDFATSASLDPGFSEAVANWIKSELKSLGDELKGAASKWHLIELGGGAGHLSAGILRSLGWSLRRRTQYHVVELSPVLRDIQLRRLGRRAKRVRWHTKIEDAVKEAGGRAIVFSNEFVDAFPATVVQWDGDAESWLEVYLEGRGEGRFAEVLLPLKRQVVGGAAALALNRDHWRDLPHRDGQRCEILFSWADWLREWISKVDAVSLLTVDYGDAFPSIYRGRPNGTLRAYSKHRRLEGFEVYANAGQQDLTTDVNFSDLQNWGESMGVESIWLTSQRKFLQEFCGKVQPENLPAAEYLQNSAGAGEAFKVLLQRKLRKI